VGDQSRPGITVAWSDDAVSLTAAVRQLVVEDHDRLVDEARITLDDAHELAANAFAPGQAIDVAMGWGDERTRIFTGKIVRVGGSTGSQGGITLVVHDPSAAMHRARVGRPFPEKSKLSAIVRAVKESYTDIPEGEVACDPDPTFEAPNVPSQLDRTDYQFLQELAAVWGCRCFVEVNDEAAQFYFKSVKSLFAAKPLATLSHCRGWGNVLTFRYERVAARAARQLVNTVTDPRTGTPTVTQGTPPPAPPPASGTVAPDVATAEPGVARANETATKVAAATPPEPPLVLAQLGLPSDPAKAASLVVTDPTQVIGYRGVAKVVGHAGLRAKGRVTVNGIATWAEGDWWVKRATHTWTKARDARDRPTASWETELELTR
jgi:phage protein D